MRSAVLVLVWWLAAAVSVAGQSLTLAWDPSPSITAVAYRVYSSVGGQISEQPLSATSLVIPVQYDTDYTFWMTALDITGLEGPISNTASGRVNSPAPPPLSAIWPSSLSLTVGAAPVTVSFDAPIPQGGVAPYATACSPASGSLFYEGGTQVACQVTDAAQQRVTGGFVVTVIVVPPADVNAPLVSLAVKRSGNSANFTATMSATDNVGVVSLQLALDGRVVCATNPCSYTAKLTRGTHTFIATGKDAAGNFGMAARTVTY